MLDYHVHTRYCRHAAGEVEDYVRVALSLGLDEIGFADHFPMFYLPELPYSDYSMDLEELPAYVGEVEKVRGMFSDRISVKVGVEVDYQRGKEALLKKAVSTQEFDYLIGVVHLVDGWVIDDTRNMDKFREYDLDRLYRKYFDELEALVKSGIFDIVGHIDVIKRFNFIPEGGVEQYVLPCLDLIAEKGLCVELNTSGLDRPVGDTYPGLNLLEAMRRRRIPVTLGSDAHDPVEVGRHFGRVLEELKKSGYLEVASFEKRMRSTKSLYSRR